MKFRHFNSLRVFTVVAEHMNMGKAATELNLTKGAVSYQVQQLEQHLGFSLFTRASRNLILTKQGEALLWSSRVGFQTIEDEIRRLTRREHNNITIGVATYFASRWLSPKLMNFMAAYPDIGLRINPLIDLIDVTDRDVDILIRWGKGGWAEAGKKEERIMNCPAMLTCSKQIGLKIKSDGIESVARSVPLLHDRDSSLAWQDWFEASGISMPSFNQRLVIQDPNVRAQAVIDGQGLALYDELIADEVINGRIFQYTKTKLENYGFYVLYPENTSQSSPIMKFRNWLIGEGAIPI